MRAAHQEKERITTEANERSPDLLRLAARAATIDERLAGGYLPIDSPESRALAEQRLETWIQAATAGDRALFEKKVSQAGHRLDQIVPLLGEVQLAPGAAPPAWIATYSRVRESLISDDTPLEQGPSSPPKDSALAFEDLYAPVVRAARIERDALAGAAAVALLSDEALAALDRGLLERLCRCVSPAIQESFALYRIARQPASLLHGRPVSADANSTKTYRQFVNRLRHGQIDGVFEAKPVAARVLATVVGCWIEATSEFLRRLSADLGPIQDELGGAGDLGPVETVGYGLSDPHNGGRTVIGLRFANGLAIGYKPKDLGPDQAWRALLAWLKRQDAPASARPPKVVARDGYGWVEWVSPSECSRREDVEAFFERAGAMLCLVHLLQGTDFHSGNVIAAGSDPVPIDLETLMHPRSLNVLDGEVGPAAAEARRSILASALRTAYLPYGVPTIDGNVSVVGGVERGRIVKFPALGFRLVNSDAMELAMTEFESSSIRRGLPTFDGETIAAQDHAERIVHGYQRMYRFWLRRRNDLLAPGGPLEAFASIQGRCVLRGTRIYAGLLRRSLHPSHLSDGVSWSANFHLLTRLSTLRTDSNLSSRLQRAERRALARLDIPLFRQQADGTAVQAPGGEPIADVFEESSFIAMGRQVRALSKRTLERDVEIVRLALDGASAKAAPPKSWANVGLQTSTSLLREKAVEIGERLAGRAFRAGDEAAWLGRTSVPGDDFAQLSVIRQELYSGAAGVGLFFAALYKATGRSVHKEMALASLARLRSDLNRPDCSRRLGRVLGVGGAAGLGSIVYGFMRAAQWLDEPTLLGDGRRAALLIDDNRIAEDERLDLTTGSAGALTALLALSRSAGEPPSEAALGCARRLIGRQVETPTGGRAWKTIDRHNCLTGAAHGAAGIAFSLLRLYEATGEESYRDAALQGVAYERSQFVPESGNWPDLRTWRWAGHDSRLINQWCQGAAGIGLLRLSTLNVMDDSVTRTEIETAIETTRNEAILPRDNLCCGNFGRLELLLEAGRRLDRPELVTTARDRAAQLVAHADATGSFRWAAGTDSHNPGLFVGVAGIGYQLLRLEQPAKFPSILSWG